MAAKKSKAEKQAELNKANAEVANTPNVDAATETEVAEAPVAEVKKPKAPGKIAQIIGHFKSGKTTKEIAQLFVLDENGQQIPTEEKDADGNIVFETFHPTTISIQVNKYKKSNPDLYPPQAPAPTKKEKAAAKKAAKETEDKTEEVVAGAEAANAEA